MFKIQDKYSNSHKNGNHLLSLYSPYQCTRLAFDLPVITKGLWGQKPYFVFFIVVTSGPSTVTDLQKKLRQMLNELKSGRTDGWMVCLNLKKMISTRSNTLSLREKTPEIWAESRDDDAPPLPILTHKERSFILKDLCVCLFSTYSFFLTLQGLTLLQRLTASSLEMEHMT